MVSNVSDGVTNPVTLKSFTKAKDGLQALWERLLVAECQALAVGALVPIETEFEYLQESGIHFLVRVAGNLQRKSEDKLRHSPPPAPGAVTDYNLVPDGAFCPVRNVLCPGA